LVDYEEFAPLLFTFVRNFHALGKKGENPDPEIDLDLVPKLISGFLRPNMVIKDPVEPGS